MANPLQIVSASEVNLGTIRVVFSRPPQRADVAGAHDSLNPLLYALTGPAAIFIRQVQVVRGNVSAVDLVLSQALQVGTWTLTASTSIWTYDDMPLEAPHSAVFTVTSLSFIEGVNQGTVTDTAADRLRRHLNPVLKGKFIDAAIEALATGDQHNTDNARKAFDQLFLSSASGSYLTERAGDQGVQRPADLGMTDSRFRDYALRSGVKLTEESLLELLEVFYGTDSVMGYVQSAAAEPFFVYDGDDLTVLVDGTTTVKTTFITADFQTAGAASAVEVVAALNRSFRLNGVAAYAIPYVDAETGYVFVRIYSGSRGLSSSIQVRGGKSMVAFLFPTVLGTHTINPSWDIVHDAATDRLRFSPNSAFNMSLVQVGDIASIYGTYGTLFDPANTGSYEIVKVYKAYTGGVTLVQYFEVMNPDGVSQALVTADIFDLVVFRPVRGTVHNTPERAVIVSSVGDTVKVTLPATSVAVNREALHAAYLATPPSVLVSNSTLLRRPSGVVTVDTVDPHTLTEGSWCMVDNVYPSMTSPPVTAGSAGLSSHSLGSHWADPGAAAATGKVRSIACLLGDGRALVSGGYDPATSAPNALTSSNGSHTFSVSALTEVADGEFQATYASTLRPAGAVVSGAGVSVGNAAGGSLFDGRAFVTGGSNAGAVAVVSCSTFDTVTNTWAFATNMGTARWGHGQSTIQDLPAVGAAAGKVLVTGGSSAYLGAALATTEMYSPLLGTWAAKASMSVGRVDHVQIPLNDGRILVIGGRTLVGGYDLIFTTLASAGPSLNSCELYDPATNTWTKTGSMSWTRFLHKAVVLTDGRVLVVGGYGYKPHQPGTAAGLRDAEIWDPATGAWRPAGRTAFARETPIAHLLSTGKVLVTGGATSTRTELFDPTTMRWRLGLGNTLLRPWASSVGLANGLVFIGGGSTAVTGGVADSLLRLYVPAADTIAAGRLNGIFKVKEVVDSTTFTYETPDQKAYTLNESADATVTPMAAQSND